jgi:enterochelin esterase-like enzyme
MDYVNPPVEQNANSTHKTFFSRAYDHLLGYNVYTPAGYDPADPQKKYAVRYHLHGFQEHESTNVAALLDTLERENRICVFPNNTPAIGDRTDFHDEEMLTMELLPLIDREYNTIATREGRLLSGFSMGGNMAFLYAVMHPELFSSVLAYAGTYHHSFHKGAQTVGVPRDQAAELYAEMIRDGRDYEPGNVLCLIRENAHWLRTGLAIELRVGTDDILICDNEIVHRHLTALEIPHTYSVFEGIGHSLRGLV